MPPMPTIRPFPLLTCLLLAAASVLVPARAELADRGKPLEVTADTQGSVDMLKQVIVFTGNVEITKGSLSIKAERVEVREAANGYRTAIATGGNGPATFRQKRDGVDEYIEGQAAKLEYEERGDIVRFIEDARVRRLQGQHVAEEISGSLITYNSTTEVFKVSGGSSSAAGSDGSGGRVRAILTPRAGSEAANAARDAATAPDSGARR